MASSAVLKVDLEGKLPTLASGKVRELFEVDDKTLLFVASDRISAFDIIMDNGIPGKGALLTKMSIYWFKYLQTQIPTLHTHYISPTLPPVLHSLPATLQSILQPRSMCVLRLRILPLESIVRGYITGSAWKEYTQTQTVNSIRLPTGLVHGQKLPRPLWGPSTKAAAGEHDENISPARAREMVGEKLGAEVERLSLEIYEVAAKRAEEVGLVLADTKLEFGVDEEDRLVLVDEVLTPDSSRFWDGEAWERNLGGKIPSFDKQPLRDWLVKKGLDGKEGVSIDELVVAETVEKYHEACRRITGMAV